MVLKLPELCLLDSVLCEFLQNGFQDWAIYKFVIFIIIILIITHKPLWAIHLWQFMSVSNILTWRITVLILFWFFYQTVVQGGFSNGESPDALGSDARFTYVPAVTGNDLTGTEGMNTGTATLAQVAGTGEASELWSLNDENFSRKGISSYLACWQTTDSITLAVSNNLYCGSWLLYSVTVASFYL